MGRRRSRKETSVRMGIKKGYESHGLSVAVYEHKVSGLTPLPTPPADNAKGCDGPFVVSLLLNK